MLCRCEFKEVEVPQACLLKTNKTTQARYSVHVSAVLLYIHRFQVAGGGCRTVSKPKCRTAAREECQPVQRNVCRQVTTRVFRVIL